MTAPISHRLRNTFRYFSVFCLTNFFLLTSSKVYAVEENSSQVVTLKPIVISAKRAFSEGGSFAENVTVYTEEDIKALPGRDLGEVLSFIPGVDIKTTNQFGQPVSMSIQGASSRQVLLMVDGIPFNTQLSGQANPTRIPIDHIKRIEVVKGASSSVWGSSLGGVINVITKDVGTTDTPKGTLTNAFAEFETFKEILELSGKAGEMGYYFSGSYFETEGIRAGADNERNDVFAKLSMPVGDQAKVTGFFGYVQENIADRYTDPVFGLTEDKRLNYARYGKIELNVDKPTADVNVAIKYNNQSLKTDLDLIDFGFLSPVISSNVFYGLSLNGSVQVREKDMLVFGTDFDWTVFKTNGSLSDSKSVNTQAPYVNYTLYLDNWTVIPGVRYDRNNEFGSQVSPSFGTIYDFQNDKQTKVRFKYSRAFNAPPLLWIFQSSAFTLPNPGLKPEKGDVYEMGINSDILSSVNVDLSVFWAEIEDAIGTVRISGKTRRENFEKFMRRGGELFVHFDINKNVKTYTALAFNDVRDKETNEIVRDQGVARKSVKIGINYNNDNGFGLDLISYYNQWNSDPDLAAKDQKFIVDAKLTQKIKNISEGIDMELFLIIHNLTNSKYWSSVTFPLPERYFEGGLTLEF